MKANLKITFDRYGECVTGHIEDEEMYRNVKSGKNWWRDSYVRITHIRIPKATFERLLALDKTTPDELAVATTVLNMLRREIKDALRSNYEARQIRLEKHGEDDFTHTVDGKISALEGIESFIDTFEKHCAEDVQCIKTR